MRVGGRTDLVLMVILLSWVVGIPFVLLSLAAVLGWRRQRG